MSKIPELAKPGTMRPHWMAAIVTGASTNARLPLSHLGALPKGAILVSLASYVADTASTTDADPGTGKVRWNNATQASATQLFVDDVDGDANDYSSLWATLLSGGYLYAYDPDDLDVWQQWSVTSVTDASGYLKLGVSLVASNGSFGSAADMIVTIQQPNPATGADRNVVTALASSSGVVTVDVSLGDFFTFTPTEAVTGWTLINEPPGYAISIVLKQGSTPYAVAMPSGLKWPGGTAGAFSTAANKVDELSISSTNTGATRRALLSKDFS